jgi:hypothetical protein
MRSAGGPTIKKTHIPVDDVVLVEILERHEELPKVVAGAEETHRRVRRLGRLGKVEKDASGAVLQHLVRHESTG